MYQQLLHSKWMPLLFRRQISQTNLSMDLMGMWEKSTKTLSVYFPCIKETHTITAFTYFGYSQTSGQDIFVCRQIPLLLGFAPTIHRSKGMTLPSVALHCEWAFESGQIGVGLSWVRSTSDITVYNICLGLCPPHSPALQDFMMTVLMMMRILLSFLTISKILLKKLTIQTMMYTHLPTVICLMIWNLMPCGRNSSINLLWHRLKSISTQF